MLYALKVRRALLGVVAIATSASMDCVSEEKQRAI